MGARTTCGRPGLRLKVSVKPPPGSRGSRWGWLEAGVVFGAAGVRRKSRRIVGGTYSRIAGKSRRKIKVKYVRVGFGLHTWSLQEYNPILTQNRIVTLG